MSWWNNIENTVGSLFGGRQKSTTPATPTAPADPEAPIKSLMKNAPKLSGVLGDNARMKQQLLDGSFKKGGKVKKTGVYKLHKGEEVLTKKKAMAHKM